jgi:predicted dithiol-disulfide oxidoreductase (DUF899 family)
MSAEQILALEEQIFKLGSELRELQKAQPGVEVSDYPFQTASGVVSLSELFGPHDRLLAIHNMGQACRYCTLWADGFNGFLPHLEAAMAVVLLSKDDPETQRRFANSRGWRFTLASHGGGDYMKDQSTSPDYANMPGAVVYLKRDGKIYRKNSTSFGPGDNYCAFWDLLGMAGLGEAEFTPQFNYWQRPATLDDGGENVLG